MFISLAQNSLSIRKCVYNGVDASNGTRDTRFHVHKHSPSEYETSKEALAGNNMKNTQRLVVATYLIAFPILATSSLADTQATWNFAQSNEDGRNIASLSYDSSNTKTATLKASCELGEETSSAHSPKITVLTDFGKLLTGSTTELRFTGGGQEFEFPATVEKDGQDARIAIEVSNDHPLWTSLEKTSEIAVQVPGYFGHRLALDDGKIAIRNFIATCQLLTNNGLQTGANTTPQLSERKAFSLAKEFNTATAWRAFLKAYPKGFFAELAKGFLKKQSNGEEQPSNPPEEPLAYINPGRDKGQWYTFDYQQRQNKGEVFAAGVKSNGVEFFAWCGRNRMMNLGLRETTRKTYPNFSQRIQQGINNLPLAELKFSDGSRHALPMVYFVLNSEVGFEKSQRPGGLLIESLMKGNFFSFERTPFGATFQLNGSKKALCQVLERCDVSVLQCQR